MQTDQTQLLDADQPLFVCRSKYFTQYYTLKITAQMQHAEFLKLLGPLSQFTLLDVKRHRYVTERVNTEYINSGCFVFGFFGGFFCVFYRVALQCCLTLEFYCKQ